MSWMIGVRLFLSVCSLAGASVLAVSPVPGTVNYSEGQVSTVSGSTIRTGDGMAEILLSPGALLRLGKHSELAVQPLALNKGEAMIEVLHLSDCSSVTLAQNGVVATIKKPGLYYFNRDRSTMAVYDGAVRISKGAKQITLEKGGAVKTRNLREFQTSPDSLNSLYAWSSFRSEQLSLESASVAQTYAGDARDWHKPDWYWDPWSKSYTFLFVSGHINGPFGWPFYAPGPSHNYIPGHHGGDPFLHAPPARQNPGPAAIIIPPPLPPTVPLAAPGIPQFPNNRGFGHP